MHTWCRPYSRLLTFRYWGRRSSRKYLPRFTVLRITSGLRPWFFYQSTNHISIFRTTGHTREKTAGGLLGVYSLGALSPPSLIHIASNVARKPISPVVVCHWRRNNDHSHFFARSLRWQIALCCESRINWPIDLYRPLSRFGFHFYAPWLAIAPTIFRSFAEPTPLVGGVDMINRVNVLIAIEAPVGRYVYVLIAGINGHPLEWRMGRKLFWFWWGDDLDLEFIR